MEFSRSWERARKQKPINNKRQKRKLWLQYSQSTINIIIFSGQPRWWAIWLIPLGYLGISFFFFPIQLVSWTMFSDLFFQKGYTNALKMKCISFTWTIHARHNTQQQKAFWSTFVNLLTLKLNKHIKIIIIHNIHYEKQQATTAVHTSAHRHELWQSANDISVWKTEKLFLKDTQVIKGRAYVSRASPSSMTRNYLSDFHCSSCVNRFFKWPECTNE